MNTHKPQVCYKHVFNKFLLNSIRNKEQTKIKKTVSADYGYSKRDIIRKDIQKQKKERAKQAQREKRERENMQ